jgi:type VI secretion system VasI family protein
MIALGKILKTTFFLTLLLAAALHFLSYDANAQNMRLAAQFATEDPMANEPVYAVPAIDMSSLKVHVERCNGFEEYILRLRCFDNIAADLGFQAPAEKAKEEKLLGQFEKWQVVEKINNVGEFLIEATLPANVPYVAADGTPITPELIFSCKTKYTDVLINWKAALVPTNLDIKNLDVVYIFDSETGIKANWNISLDRYALFIPRPIPFIQSLHGKRVLTIQMKPNVIDLETMVFTLKGMEDVLKLLAQRCYN